MLDAEQVHNLSLDIASRAPSLADFFSPLKPQNKYELSVNGLKWNFPVGVAAGFDKNAQAIKFFEKLGFGSLEVGTITKIAQAGNLKPRIFRHKHINSIQNAMGFPNSGSQAILKNIQNSSHQLCLGANLGKNKETSEADTANEYAELYKIFAPVSDYLVINISSPNTPGLRSFQKKEMLLPILEAVTLEQKIHPKPLFIKLSPDLAQDDTKMICELAKQMSLSGIIATNTTTQHQFGVGGLSGRYIQEISRSLRAQVCEYLKETPEMTIIGVGGIENYSQIKEFWKLGGHFAQVYTSFIYHGPEMLKNIARELSDDLDKYQFQSTNDLVQNIHNLD